MISKSTFNDPKVAEEVLGMPTAGMRIQIIPVNHRLPRFSSRGLRHPSQRSEYVFVESTGGFVVFYFGISVCSKIQVRTSVLVRAFLPGFPVGSFALTRFA